MSLTLALSMMISWADDPVEPPEPPPLDIPADCTAIVTNGGNHTARGSRLSDALDEAGDDSVICIEIGRYARDAGYFVNDKSLTLVGLGSSPDGVTIDKNNNSSNWVLDITGGAHVTLINLQIDGRERVRGIGVEGGSLVLVGSEIVNGERGGGGAEGAGIRLRANDHLSVFRSTFENNQTDGSGDERGGHIFHYGGTGSVRIVDSSFSGGHAGRGGAIAMGPSDGESGGTLEIFRSTFSGNRADESDRIGGAINVRGTGTEVFISESHFEDNRGRRGGAIGMTGGKLRVVDSTFIGNQADQATSDRTDMRGGGAFSLSNVEADFERCTFEDNVSDAKGGAGLIRGDSGSLSLSQNEFMENSAARMGGHLAVVDGATLFAERNRFSYGDASGGGAVACWQASCDIEHSGFWRNFSDRDGPARGGGAVLAYEGVDTSLTRNLFCGNAMSAPLESLDGTGGGAVTLLDSASALRNNVYGANSSGRSGGAIYARYTGAMSSRFETFVANSAEQGCSIFARAGDHEARFNVYTQSTCDPMGLSLFPIGYVLHAYDTGDLFARSSIFFNDPSVEGTHNSDVDAGSFTTDLDPGLPLIDLPLGEMEQCREIYDFGPPDSEVLDREEVGATSGDDAPLFDADGDGVSWLFDCDDTDPDVLHEGLLWPDKDGDGFGDSSTDPIFGCPVGDLVGWVYNGDDCDDSDPAINPDADELCDDVDRNCDGSTTDGAVDAPDWYPDMDGDSYGVAYPGAPYKECDPPSGIEVDGRPVTDWADRAEDCDDDDDTVFPDAPERCDGQFNDCNSEEGWVKPGAPAAESDRDGDSYVECDFTGGRWVTDTIPRPLEGQDCDDDDPFTYPGADEICDGVYNRCEDRESDPTGAPIDEQDRDGDLYVVCELDVEVEAWRGTTEILGGEDCNDDDATVYPTAEEICDGQYNDCSALDYDPAGAPEDETDLDGDFYVACGEVDLVDWRGPGSIVGGADCAPLDPTVHPHAEEICDGQYNDCIDPEFSEEVPPVPERDQDGDGWIICDPDIDLVDWRGPTTPEGGGDCDDLDSTVYPGAEELCDGQFNDCLATDYHPAGAPPLESDLDGDRYVACGEVELDGWVGSDLITGGADCNDDDDTVYPTAEEICDGQFNDCLDPDYSPDGAPPLESDLDGDFYVACGEVDLADWRGPDGILGGADCNDDDPTVHPNADEICDGQYNDCLDPDFATDSAPPAEQDRDGDQWAECILNVSLEDWKGSPILGGADCDDDDDTVYPAAEELCDGQFNDCLDGSYSPDGAPEVESDMDGDNWVACDLDVGLELWKGSPDIEGGGDCDDSRAWIHPEATEVYYDGVDQNCDGHSDFDPDHDGTIWPDYAERHTTFMLDWAPDSEEIWELNDCYDEGDSELFARIDPEDRQSEPVLVQPDELPAPENTWYNGIDDTCSYLRPSSDGQTFTVEILNDFDQDGDGYMRHDMRDEFLAYVERYVNFERPMLQIVEEDDDRIDDEAPLGTFPLRDAFIDAFGATETEWNAHFDTWGRDCDDTDSNVFPGSPGNRGWTDDCERAVDQDDSRPLPEDRADPSLGSGCACSSSGSPAPGGLLAIGAILGGLLLRRRRQRMG